MTPKPDAPSHPPLPVGLYGALGLLPFMAPPVIGALVPATAGLMAQALGAYAGLILSFLGGARWAFTVAGGPVNSRTIGLAMLPTLAGWGLVLLPEGLRAERLAGLALALAIHAVWDLRSPGLPGWYSALRLPLSVMACLSLLAGAVLLRG